MSDIAEEPHDHQTPRDLLELFEVLEWQKAVDARQAAHEEGDA